VTREKHGSYRNQRHFGQQKFAGGAKRVTWDAVATFALAFVTLVGLNLGAIRWLLTRYQEETAERLEAMRRGGTEFSQTVERELLKLKAELPVEYVRREDWIRFGNTLEAKLDAMRAEVRAEISELREQLYQRPREFPVPETAV
jgi:hypothetical protein